MNIDKRLREARRDSWVASEVASEAGSWTTSGAASWASQYEECTYEVQVEILKENKE
jgi:hypothetical protein